MDERTLVERLMRGDLIETPVFGSEAEAKLYAAALNSGYYANTYTREVQVEGMPVWVYVLVVRKAKD